MQWPSVFSTSSGVYALGVERYYSPDNNLVISKMLDTNGANWTEPVRLTRGLSIVTANGGIDVSGGRVAKASPHRTPSSLKGVHCQVVDLHYVPAPVV